MARVCVEFDCDGTGTGSSTRTYTTVVGDGTQADFAVDHNLNSQGVFLLAYNATTGERLEDYSVVFNTADRATVRFDTPPAPNSAKLQFVAVVPAM